MSYANHWLLDEVIAHDSEDKYKGVLKGQLEQRKSRVLAEIPEGRGLGEKEDGPEVKDQDMPEIDAVGDLADEAQGFQLEKARGQAARVEHGRDDPEDEEVRRDERELGI